MEPQHCPNGHLASPGSRFCTECGASMVPIPVPYPSTTLNESATADGAEIAPALALTQPGNGAPGPKNAGWSGLRIAAVGTLLALVVGTVVVSIVVSTDDDEAPVVAVEEAPVDPLVAAAQRCSDDFSWAADQIVANGDSGLMAVANEWGTQDGRIQQVTQFVSTFRLERDRVGQDAAAVTIVQQINAYCADAVGLVLPSNPAP